MVKVLYDSQVFSWQKVGGISRYFVELIEHLKSDIQTEIPLFYSNNIYINKRNNRSLESLLSKDFYGRDRLISFLNNRLVEQRLRTNNFDIFHPTYFDPYFLNYLEGKPFVLTIHDMIPENFPENFPLSETLISNKKKLAYKASKIISISNATKVEILKHYDGINENKIEIIHHGSNFSTDQFIYDGTLNIPSDYLLFVGQREGYKNFKRFLNAFVKVSKTYPSLYIICTGQSFSEEEKRMIQESNLTDKILHFFSSDNDLRYLYQKAKFFIFPSLEEGFGLPILEAMASQCPIICSDISCFREIAGSAALYFDCKNEDSISDVIMSALRNKSDVDRIIKLGIMRIKDFSWEKSSLELSKIYRNFHA